ncbi:MAG: aminoacetone oxidase family FAD-binding enzyme, partial [Pseudobutyrivibrio sp.]|nr:aminoacetone oxidase family FAD-binding enzyme [Pseudobutyrivibrio sp.]
GLKVAIFEKNELLGRKILSTGNGRCNFTNELINEHCLNSGSSEEQLLDFDSYINTLKLYDSLGIRTKSINGFYYPLTNQAKTVKDSFESEIKSLNCNVYLSSEIHTIVSKENGYAISDNNHTFYGKYIVLACGGKAAPAVGGTDKGYILAEQLGLKVSEIYPALTGFLSNDSRLKLLAGVRAQGKVTFEDKSFEGEIQFNKDGISGYPVMCLSRHITSKTSDDRSVKLVIDFIPELNEKDLNTELSRRFNVNNSNKSVGEALIGLIHEKCLQAILVDMHMVPSSSALTVTEEEIHELVKALKNFSIKITKSKGFEGAQVTAGGVLLNQINLDTMMVNSSKYKDVYVVGELLDVDGICGGYNLEWARHSAMCAANDIIKKYDSD